MRGNMKSIVFDRLGNSMSKNDLKMNIFLTFEKQVSRSLV